MALSSGFCFRAISQWPETNPKDFREIQCIMWQYGPKKTKFKVCLHVTSACASASTFASSFVLNDWQCKCWRREWVWTHFHCMCLRCHWYNVKIDGHVDTDAHADVTCKQCTSVSNSHRFRPSLNELTPMSSSAHYINHLSLAQRSDTEFVLHYYVRAFTDNCLLVKINTL